MPERDYREPTQALPDKHKRDLTPIFAHRREGDGKTKGDGVQSYEWVPSYESIEVPQSSPIGSSIQAQQEATDQIVEEDNSTTPKDSNRQAHGIPTLGSLSPPFSSDQQYHNVSNTHGGYLTRPMPFDWPPKSVLSTGKDMLDSENDLVKKSGLLRHQTKFPSVHGKGANSVYDIPVAKRKTTVDSVPQSPMKPDFDSFRHVPQKTSSRFEPGPMGHTMQYPRENSGVFESLSEIEIQRLQRMQQIRPDLPIATLLHAFRLAKGNTDAAMMAIMEIPHTQPKPTFSSFYANEDNVVSAAQSMIQRKVAATQAQQRFIVPGINWSSMNQVSPQQFYNTHSPVPTNSTKRATNTKASIRDKYGNANQTPLGQEINCRYQEQLKPQLKKRLIRPEQRSVNASPQLQEHNGFVHAHTAAKAHDVLPVQIQPAKRIKLDSDDDESTASTPEEIIEHDPRALLRALSFLNETAARSIADVAGCNDDVADIVVAARPFRSLDQIRDLTMKTGKFAKRVGDRIVDATLETLESYDAVDSLISQVEVLGKRISDEIEKWGIIPHASNGELELVDGVDINDSALGTTLSEAENSLMREQPKLLAPGVKLKGFQLVGVNWLVLLYEKKLSCILADEMGLGKTCQVIAFLAHLLANGENGPHLIVVPASTLENWLREFQRFCPNLKVVPYYGSQVEREEARYALIKNANFNVLVTTYALATGAKSDRSFLKQIAFNTCVYDEGHMLKNSNSSRYMHLMNIRARFRLLLTGTVCFHMYLTLIL